MKKFFRTPPLPRHLVHNYEGQLCIIPDRWKDQFDFMKFPEMFIKPEKCFPMNDLARTTVYPKDAIVEWGTKEDGVIEIRVESAGPKYECLHVLPLNRSMKLMPKSR